MNQSLTLFLVAQGFAVGCALVGIYVKVSTKLRELEIRVGAVERQDNAILDKLEGIGDDIQEIKVEMQNKQNRA